MATICSGSLVSCYMEISEHTITRAEEGMGCCHTYSIGVLVCSV